MGNVQKCPLLDNQWTPFQERVLKYLQMVASWMSLLVGNSLYMCDFVRLQGTSINVSGQVSLDVGFHISLWKCDRYDETNMAWIMSQTYHTKRYGLFGTSNIKIDSTEQLQSWENGTKVNVSRMSSPVQRVQERTFYWTHWYVKRG